MLEFHQAAELSERVSQISTSQAVGLFLLGTWAHGIEAPWKLQFVLG